MTLSSILTLFQTQGSKQYDGEAVSQLEHALQTALLAQEAGASPSLIAACLLHDLGHLTPAEEKLPIPHEYRALKLLKPLFGPEITEPIRLHVHAKRYLCAVEPDYWQYLSLASQESLELQGGIFSSEEVEMFRQLPYSQQAIQLRYWDELAKIPDLATPTLEYYQPMLHLCTR